MNKNSRRFVRAAHKAYHSKDNPENPYSATVDYNQTTKVRRLYIGAVPFKPGRRKKLYKLREDLPKIC